MARVVSRCCGGAWISRIRTPSNGRAAPGRKGRLGVLSAVCALVLAAPVATARAEDPPQLPVPPTVPTIAVQVSVSIPSVSVSVQVGTVGVSVSTAPVEVSVSAPTPAKAPRADPAAAAPPPPQKGDPGHCCAGEPKAVAPVKAAVQPRRPARAAPPRQSGHRAHRAHRVARAGAKAPRPHTIAASRAVPTTRAPAVMKVPGATRARRARPPTAERGCCESAPAAVAVAAAPTRIALPPDVTPPDGVQRAEAAPAASPGEPERASDNRLLLQLGVLGAFLYLVCLAGWFSATRPRRRRA